MVEAAADAWDRPKVAAAAVFDPETIVDAVTFQDPHPYEQGIHHVFVAGQAALLDGEMTGTRPGRVLRSSDYR